MCWTVGVGRGGQGKPYPHRTLKGQQVRGTGGRWGTVEAPGLGHGWWSCASHHGAFTVAWLPRQKNWDSVNQ